MSGFDSRPGGAYRSISLGAMPAVAEKAPELLRDAGSRTGFGAHFWNLPINAAFRRRADGSVSFHPWPWPLRVGAILPNPEVESRLQRLMKCWLYAALPTFVLCGIIGPRALIALTSAYAAA